MRKCLCILGILPALVGPALAETNDLALWKFKVELLPILADAVPALLKSQDATNGHFGRGPWIANDQVVIYPLAAAWAINAPTNRWFHDPKLLEAIMLGGDALIAEQDKNGQWMFRKKDGSTWGLHYDPWVYSRWVRAFSLISSNMPPERRARWVKALELGFRGIAARELGHVHNIPAHHAMGLYVAGQALKHPEWCAQAGAFLEKVAEVQDTNGFWTEHVGPVVNYNFVYVDALGTYYGISHDPRVLPALERAARFHANFTYPDGSNIETVDERNPYSRGHRVQGVGFSFTPEGRGYLRRGWAEVIAAGEGGSADAIASLLLYGEEGPVMAPPGTGKDSVFVSDDGKASVVRKDPWCAVFSAHACPVYKNRWIQDRQNFVSLFHEKPGLILGGGNTKLQPLWSTFTVGDTSLLQHREGDQKPDFSEPAGLLHVPTRAMLATNGQAILLEYGQTKCSVSLDLSQRDKARLTYAADCRATSAPVEAHVTLLPSPGKIWRTASGKTGTLGAKPIELAAGETGGWFEHDGWRIEVPAGATIRWPVLPHNPYRKDGRAEIAEGRIVVTLPFPKDVPAQDVVVSVTR